MQLDLIRAAAVCPWVMSGAVHAERKLPNFFLVLASRLGKIQIGLLHDSDEGDLQGESKMQIC